MTRVVDAAGAGAGLPPPLKTPPLGSMQPVGSAGRPLHSSASNVVWTGPKALTLNQFKDHFMAPTPGTAGGGIGGGGRAGGAAGARATTSHGGLRASSSSSSLLARSVAGGARPGTSPQLPAASLPALRPPLLDPTGTPLLFAQPRGYAMGGGMTTKTNAPILERALAHQPQFPRVPSPPRPAKEGTRVITVPKIHIQEKTYGWKSPQDDGLAVRSGLHVM